MANPSEADPHFPISRCFDWYHGHSWAKGLFESADGKDEESSSEDVFSAYAIKMWGRTTGDMNMEARGNLMLAILARSLRSYFLMEDSNTNHPANFVPNKVTGIVSGGCQREVIDSARVTDLVRSSSKTRLITLRTLGTTLSLFKGSSYLYICSWH